MVQCDSCGWWLHMECLDPQEASAGQQDHFVCTHCDGQSLAKLHRPPNNASATSVMQERSDDAIMITVANVLDRVIGKVEGSGAKEVKREISKETKQAQRQKIRQGKEAQRSILREEKQAQQDMRAIEKTLNGTCSRVHMLTRNISTH